MKATEFLIEHKKNRKAKKYNSKPTAVAEPSKPRNFVAKNAINTGAGAHKDKKKAAKQGDVKHKKTAIAEEGNGMNIDELQAQLAELEKKKEIFRSAVEQARKITTEIKYDDTAMLIVNRVQELAAKVGIGEQEIKWAAADVMTKARELESAVYSLDDAFTDAYREISYKAEELEYEIDDLRNEMRRAPDETNESQKYPFAGAKVGHKEGPAGQWRNKGPKAKKPAKPGDLVG